MPIKDKGKLKCVDELRHAEYYQMQKTFDELYTRSKNREIFENLMELVLMRENILLAYRNIKANKGSNTPGTDKLTIQNIGKLTPDEVVNKVRFIITGSVHGYRPKPVRRKEIPKPNGEKRPLGIPCIWDRLIQQCIKQILEPICEARFSENSFGFRPNRSIENAVSKCNKLIQLSKLHYVVEFDIKGFFDNVNHSKLIKQIWALGIHDKHLIYVIKQILKAPIRMENGEIEYPKKGTPQGGIISPLLANIVLNELDHWIESNWENNPVIYHYSIRKDKNGQEIKSHGYRAMKTTGLKEMFIVRYADDFRIFCRTKSQAEKTLIATKEWLKERLKLEVSTEKTKVVNLKNKYMEFLGFKFKIQKKGQKEIVKSHISDKQLKRKSDALVEQAKRIARPRPERHEHGEILLYNSMVMGIQNYYQIATCINLDFSKIHRRIMTVLTNRLLTQTGNRLVKSGRPLREIEQKRYGNSKMLRYVAGTNEPIYPIGYIKHKNPIAKKWKTCCYTEEGRKGLHDNLKINISIMYQMMKQPLYSKSLEYADNRISLFSAQKGACAITGRIFCCLEDIHCHHKIPRNKGGTDKYENLVLIIEPIHKLIHARNKETIEYYINICKLDKEQLIKINELRILAGNTEIA